jgi:NTP pyrophosphatase (non-canonical NTP hydrolase)
MNIQEIQKRAVEIRNLYDDYNIKNFRSKWTRLQLAQGFVGDVGDLQKIVMAKDGLREMENIDEKLAHELADCLWSVLVLADKYDVDIEKEFLNTMNVLEKRIT